jgi:hypothetical protein
MFITLFLKQDRLAIWSIKMMFIPCSNIVYRQIGLNNFLIIDIGSSLIKVYTSQVTGSICYLNRLLQEVLGCATTIILTVCLGKVKILPLLEQIP